MTRITGPVALTLPGSFTDLELDTADASEVCYYALTGVGQVPESALILGSTFNGTQVRLKAGDPHAYRLLARLMDRCAAFLEDAQRVQGRAA